MVELWQLPADELLAAGDVGLLPWVPLTHFEGPPAPLLEECRRRIDDQALAEERNNLLTVSQVLAQLRYTDPELLTILGGKRVMIESPLINEIVAEATQKATQKTTQENILAFLGARFGAVPAEIAEPLRQVHSQKKLNALLNHAARCRDLEAFPKQL